MHFSVLLAPLLIGWLAAPCLFGQENPASGQKAKAVAAPLPPLPPPPINFRQLLAMPLGQRETILASRSPAQRQTLEKHLLEYESLSPGERESRLCTLQLRLYLRPLMELPPSARLERLGAVPLPDRTLVEERLQEWDHLPPEMQRQTLTNELALRWLFRPVPTDHAQNQDEERRQEILKTINRLLEYSDEEKIKVLNQFTDADRQRMQKTLQTFKRLSPAERERCLNGFQKFAGLSAQERQKFLSNADFWQTMSAKDRQAWQTLIYRAYAPKPPALPRAKTAPLPPELPARNSSRLTTTN